MKVRDFVHFFAFLFGGVFVFAFVHIVFGYKPAISFTELMIMSAMSTILIAIRETRK